MYKHQKFKRFLTEYVKNNLSDNLLANVVVRYYEDVQFGSPKSFFDSIFNYYKQHDKDGFPEIVLTENVKEENLAGDYRLKSLRISNVRGIGEKKEGLPYGIDFTNDKGEVQNAIILGPNGSGKSSVFGAVEFIYANQIGEAMLRSSKSLKESDFREYLTRFNSSWQSANCSIETINGKYDLDKRVFANDEQITLINPHNHFISDFDIYERGKLNFSGSSDGEDSFHHQVALSLGLQEYLLKASQISALSGYNRQTESRDQSRLEKDQNNHKLNIAKWQEELKSLEEKKKLLLGNSKNQTSNTSSSFEEVLTTLRRMDTPDLTNFSELNDTIGDYRATYNKYISFAVTEGSKTEIEFLNLSSELLEHDHIEGNCPLCNDSNKSADEILVSVKERISRLKELNQISQQLNTDYRSVIQTLNSLERSLSESMNLIQRELAETKGYAEFSNLSDRQEELLIKIKSVLDHDLFIEVKEVLITPLISSSGFKSLNNYLQIHEKDFHDVLRPVLESLKIYADYRQKALQDIAETLKNRPKTPQEQLKQVNSEIEQKNKSIKEANEQIISLEKLLKEADRAVKLSRRLINDAKEFENKVIQRVDEIIVDAIQPVKRTIEEILSDYLEDESNDVELRISTGDVEGRKLLKAEIIKPNSDIILSPNKFFNTFRFRMFSMMVSCSIAIASRKSTNANLPLVLDDLFFASDYVSRSGIKSFLIKLIKIFEKQTPDLKLQFILFTHDDSVFNYAVEAMSEYNKYSIGENGVSIENGDKLKENTLVGRLFPYDDSAKNPIGDGDDRYWNLLLNMNIKQDSDVLDKLLMDL